KAGWTEKNLYGGRVCLVNGRPFVGAVDGGLIALCPDDALAKHLELKHCTPFTQDGKALPGWVKVNMEALKTAKQLSRWVDASFQHAAAMQAAPKAPKKSSKPAAKARV